ncbi:MAG: nicotinate-nucleotide adenylyltransferase [Ignavibacteria bacterium]|nr:nicotinate-nucleotide adenylyltransferase [Ignavibacteria bacterium]
MRRIGVFGGTFDPVHNGHLIVAENVKDQMHLDTVLFIPSKIPPLKDKSLITEKLHRLNMLNIALENNSSFEISEIELQRSSEEPSYTVDTLLELRNVYASELVKFYLILGMDQLINLEKWKEPGKLFLLSEVIIINRPGYLIQQVENDYGRQSIYVPVPNVEISATDIRYRVQENRSIKYLVPDKVEEYIKKNKLYL